MTQQQPPWPSPRGNRWLILALLAVLSLADVAALPFLFTHLKPRINWTQPEMERWVIEEQPRSIQPHLEPMLHPNRTHRALSMDSGDSEFLQRLVDIRQNQTASSRMLWYDVAGGDGLVYPPFVDKALKLLNLKQVAFEIENSVMSKVTCTACRAGAGMLQHQIQSGKTDAELIRMITDYCTNLNIQSARVCQGVAQLFGSELIYVLKRVNLSPDELCSFVIGDGCADVYNPYHEWEVIFPPVPKPPRLADLPIPLEAAPFFKVLHISDTHYDPHYAEGSNADCNEPLCCRLSSGPETHKDIDYILWTGDLPPHDVWNQTKEENLAIIKETVKQMVEMFPGVPIFPALGNHESAPVNSFPPPYVNQVDISISWLYDELDVQWRRWLPQSVTHTVRRGAFYSVLVRPGFRIISLNMNYCNNKNWWLLLNSTDPATELQWFIYELQSAEFSNEKVHVIGHIPPGHSDCLKVWSRNFYKIISRYESTVTAQFYGHTHYDEFEMFYDPHDLNHPNGIAYIGPSVSPYYDLNPGYRIYYVDGDHDSTTRLVIDHESWIMNLKEANLYGYPIWYKLYTARAAYNMKALRPSDWNNLLNELTNNQELFELYYKWILLEKLTGATHLRCRVQKATDLRLPKWTLPRSETLLAEVESKIDEESSKSWKSWFYKGLTNSDEDRTEVPMTSNVTDSDGYGPLDVVIVNVGG
ncbi:hypothetical protein M5D96_007388 [Drosophila gunungcola]|uniref:Sphingomyelin phosphodiesterase n=1 Tax=Drosophila gunungcola TaxID=103775 RepID=A0A9P9YMY2_9MUSC|nr:hypothetical protein M5D96_007388 [Drosophila gunungcola]